MEIRVLLADPDQEVMQRYALYLQEFGMEVATAATALECIDLLREFRPQVLVLDPALPWGRGEGVLDLMQSEQDVPLVPVIVVSSVPDAVGLHRLGSIEVAEYHEKPLTPRAVLTAVMRVCESSMTK